MSTARRRRTARERKAPLTGALLRIAWQQVRRRMTALVHASGFDDLQETHLTVFQPPGPDGLRPSDLARQLQVSRQAANHLIAQLEALGYLQRRAARGADTRRVYLTARGRRLLAAIKASVHGIERRLEARAGRLRFKAFMEVLRMLTEDEAQARRTATNRQSRR